MRKPLELAKTERLTLQELSEHHPYLDFRHRALGEWPWRNLDLTGMLKGHQGCAPVKLTPEQLDTASVSPARRLAPCPRLNNNCAKSTPPPCIYPESLIRWLKSARGLSVYPPPRLSLKKALPSPFRCSKLEGGQKVACESKISVFYLDERGFFNVPNVQRVCAPKGKHHVADASVPRR